MEQNVIEDLVICELVKKFAAFYATRRFIIVFTRALHKPHILSQFNQMHILKFALNCVGVGLACGLFL